LYPAFSTQNFVPDFFKIPDPKKTSGPPDKSNIRVQIDWLTGSSQDTGVYL
jgi:hypothetical protein